MKQFSIRDALFLTVIVALALGWLMDRRPTPARFQVSAGGALVDTATGQVWDIGKSDYYDPKPVGK